MSLPSQFYSIIRELKSPQFIKFARLIGCPDADIADAFHCMDTNQLNERKYDLLQSWTTYLGRRNDNDIIDILNGIKHAVKTLDWTDLPQYSAKLSPYLRKNHEAAKQYYIAIQNLPENRHWNEVLTSKLFNDESGKYLQKQIKTDFASLQTEEVNYQLMKTWCENNRKSVQELRRIVGDYLTHSAPELRQDQVPPSTDLNSSENSLQSNSSLNNEATMQQHTEQVRENLQQLMHVAEGEAVGHNPEMYREDSFGNDLHSPSANQEKAFTTQENNSKQTPPN